MTLHRVLASLSFAALLALPTPAVYAGGMGGAGNAVAFECYAGSGASPTGTLTLSDVSLASTRTVTVGGLRLVCTPVTSSGWTGLRNVDDPPDACDPNQPTLACGDHLKCYDIRPVGGGGASTGDLTLNDFFFYQAPTTASRPQLLCVGAQIWTQQ